jgi:hypothetical protein
MSNVKITAFALTIALAALIAAVPSNSAATCHDCSPLNRDKTGTNPSTQNEAGSQMVVSQPLTSRQSSKAERTGFEPAVGLRLHRFSKPAHSTTLPPLPVGQTRVSTRRGDRNTLF